MASDASLPNEQDFNPWNDPLDAANAWRAFGGLTIDQAYAKFCTNSLYYQEDFMFMGGRAFAYYFPVIEKYLRNAPEINCDGDDRQAWILAHCIENQFRGDQLPHVDHLRERVIALSNFVRSNVQRFGYDDAERHKIRDAWSELVDFLERTTPS